MDIYTLLVVACMVVPSIRLLSRAKKDKDSTDLFISIISLAYASICLLGIMFLSTY